MDNLDLKILIVTGIYPPDIGGPANFTPEFSKFLTGEGHSIQVLTLSDELNHLKESIFNVRRIRRDGKLFRRFKTIFWIIRYGNSADRILVTGLYEEVGLASLFLKTKIIMRVVGDPIWERARNTSATKANIEEFNKADSNLTIQRKFLSWSINQGDLCITPSEQLRDFMLNWGITRNIKVIPNGVLIPETTTKISDLQGITVSRLVSWKNVNIVIETAIKCGVPLKVIGDGPLENQLSKYESNDLIKLLGRKNKSEVTGLLKESNIFFLLSSYEGQSFALTEALANGMLCVVSDIPGNMQLVKHMENGFIFNLLDQGDSTEELIKLLSNRSLVEDIASNARNYAVANLNTNVIANRIMGEITAL
jgi:glycosyltransferase involved in cell wall biosynthesis